MVSNQVIGRHHLLQTVSIESGLEGTISVLGLKEMWLYLLLGASRETIMYTFRCQLAHKYDIWIYLFKHKVRSLWR